MDVLQHYYTSYVNKENGSAGFQVKAMSPGIPPDTQALILRLLAYRIPSSLDEYALNTHPKALRYFYRSPQEAILLCSQSNGSDENGRPGNFFAHTLVVEPDYFASMPPILYWDSSFWRTKDPSSRLEIAPLKSLEDVETTLDIEGVWKFLAQGKRCEQFRKLMAAVVHYSTTQRRIVIIDNNADNVAQWIAAVTFMLPPDHRPLLSFSTYHHDPYQAQYMITGTASDSQFRASLDEYLSYFILDTETGKMSEVEASPYADEAWKAARSYDYYETKLLSLITNYLPRFPQSGRIDESLDAMALYAGLLTSHHAPTLTSAEIQAATLGLDTLERTKPRTQNDLDEIQVLGDLFQEVSESNDEAVPVHHRIIELRKKYKLPTDKSALKDLKFTTQFLISPKNHEAGLNRLSKMRQTYGEDMFLATINRTDYLHWLNEIVREADLDQLRAFWKVLGSYINPGSDAQYLLLVSLYKGGKYAKNPAETTEFFQQIAQSIKGKEQAWLRLAVKDISQMDTQTLLHFYLLLVHRLDLDERSSYRVLVQAIYPDILGQEMYYELAQGESQQALSILETWVNYVKRQQPNLLPQLLNSGLKFWQEIHPKQFVEWIPQILDSRILVPCLSTEWKNKLLDLSFSTVTFRNAKKSHVELYKKYRKEVDLSPKAHTIMDGLDTMYSGSLREEELSDRLYNYFYDQKPNDFAEEAGKFISVFLTHCDSELSHHYMMRSLFLDWEHSEGFWNPYWDKLRYMLSGREEAYQAFKILSYWFNTTSEHFGCLYTLQYFFLCLPQVLDEARRNKSFQEVARYAQEMQQRLRWYPLLQDYFSLRKSAVAQFGLSVASQFQKLLTNPEEGKEPEGKEPKQHTELEEQVHSLFNKRKLSRAHKEQLGNAYNQKLHTLFWSLYWEQFKTLLTSGEGADILDLLSFWFDDGFEVFKDKPAIPQVFFLGLCSSLEDVQKERGFRERARQVYARVTQHPKTYGWFGWVETFFQEQEKGFSLFRRK